MRHVAAVLLVAVAASGWATCAAAAPAASMACCVKVQHECPKMEQVKMCCPERQQTKPDSTAAGAVPIVSLSVQAHAAFLFRAAVSPAIDAIRVHPLQAAPDITPPSRHSTDCVLLI
jgi:hypothetical protein